MGRIKEEKLCVICHKRLNRGKLYCSLKCYWQKSPKFKTKCIQCQKEFWTYPSFIKAGEGILCSNLCKYQWQKSHYRGSETKLHPELAKSARSLLNHKIERNGLKRLSCEICSNPKSHAHHEDYSKPLEVKWLCAKHHQLIHTGGL